MMVSTEQCNGVICKDGRDTERSFKVLLCSQDRVRSIRVALE